jgi:hypothetical protein
MRAARRLPGLTEGDSIQLKAVLAERARWRAGAALRPAAWLPPAQADHDLAFALHYAAGCLRQDRPLFFWSGIAALAYAFIVAVQALLP